MRLKDKRLIKYEKKKTKIILQINYKTKGI